MSLAIVFKGSEGMVLAADSRVTLQMPLPIQGAAPGGPSIMLIPATFDNATKLLKVTGQDHVAAVTYGTGTVGYPEARTAHSLLPEFEATLDPKTRLAVQDFAIKLSDFFAARWTQTMPAGTAVQPMAFLIGGYDENVAYGRIFEFQIPTIPTPAERHLNTFGIMWGGQTELTSRILNGHDPPTLQAIKDKFSLNDQQISDLTDEIQNVSGAKIPYQFLPLQDCVDLAILLTRTTSQLQDYQTSLRGVGGAIDVATITSTDGFRYIQRKELRGERERS